MVFTDGRTEGIGSSDYQACELNSVASVDLPERESLGCPVVEAGAGSMIYTRQADGGSPSRVSGDSIGESTYPDGPRSHIHKVPELECNLNYENTFCHADALQTSLATSLGSTVPVSRAASSSFSSSSESSSLTFPFRSKPKPSVFCTERPDSDNPVGNKAEACQSSALGRAGNTGSIDVVSRSGLACQIRSNSVQNSTLLGRPSVQERPIVQQSTQESDIVPSQEPLRNSLDSSLRDPSEDTSRESGALRWVQALEFQGTGACRADERLRPLLRWNVSCVGSDGRLLVQLGQHFKAKELNLLARCLCAPLVHIRVGKVLRQGRLLRPTTSRGFLSLTMAPGSLMRLSFMPDTGFVDLLATISSGQEAPSVSLEEVLADMSGRTFLLKLPDGKVLYFWQSEKSKSTGDELVSKMKDLLSRRPTLSQLTRIEETRLDSFASYICSALNASSSTEAPQTPASAASAVNLQSCTGSSSTLSTKGTTSRTLTSFNGETQPVSLPGPFTRSSAEFEGDASVPPCGFSQGLSQRGVSSENTPAFSTLHRSSSASWSDDSERRSVTIRSRGVNSVSPPGSASGASEGSLSNTHDQPVLLASSWSTRTSLSDSSPEKHETSSLSAGLYTSLNTDLNGRGYDVSEKEYRTSYLTPHGIADFSTRTSMPSILRGSASPSCSYPPTVSSHLPISPASLLAPYYCPCPLGTFTPPYVPSTTEGGLISPSAPFFSVRPPSSLFPPGTLSFREFSLSPVQLPVSSLVTAAVPIHSSGISPFCTQPISSVPVLHKPTPYMGRTSSALSGYSSTSSEGVEKSFYSCLRARQALHGESCSVNLSTSSCTGVSARQSPNNVEAFTPVFDPSLSVSATTPRLKSSTTFAMQTEMPVLDRNPGGAPFLFGSFESRLHTNTMCTSRVLSQVTPFELGLQYTTRFVEENRKPPTSATVDQVSSVSSELKFKERSFFKDMVSKSCSAAGQTSHSPESCASGGSRTVGSSLSFRSESGEDLSHVTVNDMAAKTLQHSDGTLKMEEERNN